MPTTEEIYEQIGANPHEPATLGESGTVLDGTYGLVAIHDDHKEAAGELYGQVGYYDDDGWRTHPDFQDMSEDELADLDEDDTGEDVAIVYFGQPFQSPCFEVPPKWLRPATPEECVAYTMRGHKPLTTAQA